VTDGSWVIDKEGGVANIAVWILPEKGTYFPLPAKQTWKDEVVIDTPFCAFVPRVSITFPECFNGQSMTRTGQRLRAVNSSMIAHNANMLSPRRHAGIESNFGGALTPHEGRLIEQSVDSEQPIRLSCNRHPWMKGYIWALPTPYAAVTNASGAFAIEGIPAGVGVRLVVWHEVAEFFGRGGSEGETIVIQSGENGRDFTVSVPK
jgi:hypothetical protein